MTDHTAEFREQWRKIADAPKDGSHLLLSDGKRVWFGHWFKLDRAFVSDGHYLNQLFSAPTHFMPLPQPPEDAP